MVFHRNKCLILMQPIEYTVDFLALRLLKSPVDDIFPTVRRLFINLINLTVNGYVIYVDIDLVVGGRFVRFYNNPIRFVDCGEVFYIFLKVNSCGNVFDLIYNYEFFQSPEVVHHMLVLFAILIQKILLHSDIDVPVCRIIASTSSCF